MIDENGMEGVVIASRSSGLSRAPAKILEMCVNGNNFLRLTWDYGVSSIPELRFLPVTSRS